tara:strand:+ start:552 stop:719 length:168 start_codon:yes stop_codon:yes gene_type:complete
MANKIYKYKIVGSHNSKKFRKIALCKTKEEAETSLECYQNAYGKGWKIIMYNIND